MALCCVGFLALVAGQWQDRQSFRGVAVLGATALSEAAIRNAVDSIAGKAQRDVAFADVRAVVERLPYVRTASVYISGEQALTIEVQERTPVAHMVLADGGLRYVDQDGTVLPLPDRRIGFDVPLIRTSDGGTCAAGDVRAIAAIVTEAQRRLDEGLYQSVSEVVINGATGAVDMVAGGTTWRLPSLKHLRVLGLRRTFGTMNTFWTLASQRLPATGSVVDLTWNGQVIVRRTLASMASANSSPS